MNTGEIQSPLRVNKLFKKKKSPRTSRLALSGSHPTWPTWRKSLGVPMSPLVSLPFLPFFSLSFSRDFLVFLASVACREVLMDDPATGRGGH